MDRIVRGGGGRGGGRGGGGRSGRKAVSQHDSALLISLDPALLVFRKQGLPYEEGEGGCQKGKGKGRDGVY